tara:strand:+ start:595 stop:1497 length:903 start_codon:yes stop_codon:yes gene_type:complete
MSFGKGGGSGNKAAQAATTAGAIEAQAFAAAAKLQAEAEANALEELRRQFDISSERILPFAEVGARQLPAIERASTAAGLDENLAQIFDNRSFQRLREEREDAVMNQLAAGGLMRSGSALEDIANIPTDLGFALEQLLTGRKQDLGGTGLSAVTGLANLGSTQAANVSNVIQQGGRDQAAGITDAAQSRANAVITGQQARAEAATQRRKQDAQTAATIATVFFSDPALKENIEQIGKISNLNIYQWDWIKSTKDTIIEKCGTIGFMADEVKEMYPHHVYEYAGFMTIDYPNLLDELEVQK